MLMFRHLLMMQMMMGTRLGISVGHRPGTAQSAGGLTPPTTKGYGLKKWRRIRRDVIKDGNSSLDVSKILKRGHSGSGNLAKPVRAPLEEIGKDSEGSIGSTTVARNPSVVEGFAGPSGLDLNFAAGPAFAAGADSDHSEDRSSKSSTAASAPKARHDSLGALGHARERNRAKNLSGKGLGQQGKTRVESTKKPRGERAVKLQKENSQSSMESDLRSSNSIYTQGAFSTAINGMKSGKSTSYYSGNNDRAHQSGQYSDDAHACYLKENSLDGENISQDGSAAWEAEEDKDENHRSSADQDPLVRSMQALLSVQEALEKEVKKFTEIAKDPVVTIAEGQVSDLTEHVKSLEVALEETRTTLLASESRISELEAALSDRRSFEEESTTNCDSLTSKPMDELENAFRQKIEAEIEYLAIVRTIQALRVDLQSQLMLLAEQEAAVAQATSHDKLCEVETRAAQLEKQAEELEEVCEGITEAEDDVLMLRRGAFLHCKYDAFSRRILENNSIKIRPAHWIIFLSFVLGQVEVCQSASMSTGASPAESGRLMGHFVDKCRWLVQVKICQSVSTFTDASPAESGRLMGYFVNESRVREHRRRRRQGQL
ncbi:hypothetical protein MLD38_002196 [Melastoma candidum]|uniref:Uncharacterized protein n=1 Tax=Melastoma candidum TaxID=119954 RepID=A0ACB9SHN0_9MYRT|nr:hypothetical protein MLD38_002196 [Melastoma candidum]